MVIHTGIRTAEEEMRAAKEFWAKRKGKDVPVAAGSTQKYQDFEVGKHDTYTDKSNGRTYIGTLTRIIRGVGQKGYGIITLDGEVPVGRKTNEVTILLG